MPDPTSLKLTSGKVLARNALWNLLGQGAPFVVAIFAIPLLINGLGMERFGILTLAWVMVGYFGVFDISLGWALTKLVAEKLESPKQADVPAVIWTGLLLMLLLGIAGALAVWLLCPWLVHEALGIPEALKTETLSAFYALALSVPFLINTTGLRGVLEATGRFGIVTLIRIPVGVATFIGPLLVLPFSDSLSPIAIVLVATRIVAWAAHLWACLFLLPIFRVFTINRTMVKPLLHFGSWVSVTNMVNPLMVYFDRFLISALISVVAVTYYVTPFEVVIKLLVIPSAIVGVLFPAFSASLIQDRQRAAVLYYQGLKYVFLLLSPLALTIITFAPEILAIWLGAPFAENSTRVLQIIALGVLINGVAHVPGVFILSAGRPDITGKLHFIELPCYLIALWWLINNYGINGAATAWLLRVMMDAVVLLILAKRFLPSVRPNHYRLALLAALMLGAIGGAMLQLPMTTKAVLFILCSVGYAWITWNALLSVEERRIFRK